jgi:DNA invertase Pin-like site-specific DNA recombinase
MTSIALGYMRQSKGRERDDRDGGSVSVAMQLDAATKWCDAHDAALVNWHSDVDESGATVNRAGLDAFLEEAERVRPAYAVMWDVARLIRDLRSFLDIFERLEAVGCEMVSVTEGTRHSPFVWRLIALMAQEQRDRISLNIMTAKREAAKRGRHQAAAPLGYLKVDGALVRDNDTAWIVERLFALALEGHTPQAIARLANQEGLPTMGMVRAKGNGEGLRPPPLPDPSSESSVLSRPPDHITKWSRQTVIQTLRCVTYAGLVQSGKHAQSRHGKALGVIVAAAPHEPIIPRATFDAVQRHLDALRHPASGRRGSWHWLAGRIVCACGEPMYYLDAARSDGKKKETTGDSYLPVVSTNKIGANPDAEPSTPPSRISPRWHDESIPRRDRSFRCRASYKTRYGIDTPGCPLPKSRLSAPMVERAVDALMLAALTHAARVRDPAALQRAHAARQGSGAVSQRARAEKRVQELRAQRVRINDAIQQGIGDLPDLAVRDRALIEAIAAAEVELAAVPAPVSEPAARDALAMAARMRDEWVTSTPQERATWATETGLRVIVNATTGNVELRFSEPFASLFG